jgi:hypothetical protein
MESRPKLTDAEYAQLIARNRARYAATGNDEHSPVAGGPTSTAGGLELGTPDTL